MALPRRRRRGRHFAGQEPVPADPAPPSGPDAPGLGVVRRTVREVGLAFITAGVIILLFVAYQLLGTNLAEQHSQDQLKAAFDRAVAAKAKQPSTTLPSTALPSTTVPSTTVPSTTLAPAAPTPGGAIDELTIPRIGVDKYIVEGVGTDDLRRGPGHYPDTVLPGQQGNAAIAGHRTTYGAPFFRLNELQVGDPIYITNTAGQRFDYVVSQSTVVSPSDVAVLDHTPDARLTLTTCNPRFEATNRLVVVATLTGPAAPAAPTPTAPARSLGSGEAAGESGDHSLGQGNGNGWPPALAYGAVVLVLWIGTRLAVNRSRGWARVGSFAGVAVCAVPLWFCFENVVRLLPPNI